MKVTAAALEELPWKRKKRRYATISDGLQGLLLTKLGGTPPDPPVITRILGTCVYHDDEFVTMLDKQAGIEIAMELRNWVEKNHGGGIAKPYREVTELQWDGQRFWMVTF